MPLSLQVVNDGGNLLQTCQTKMQGKHSFASVASSQNDPILVDYDVQSPAASEPPHTGPNLRVPQHLHNHIHGRRTHQGCMAPIITYIEEQESVWSIPL